MNRRTIDKLNKMADSLVRDVERAELKDNRKKYLISLLDEFKAMVNSKEE